MLHILFLQWNGWESTAREERTLMRERRRLMRCPCSLDSIWVGLYSHLLQSKLGCAWKPIGTPNYCRTRICSRQDFLKKCPRIHFNWTILCRCEGTLKFPGAAHLESVTLLRDQSGPYQAWQQKCSSVENIPLFAFSYTPHTDKHTHTRWATAHFYTRKITVRCFAVISEINANGPPHR